MATQIEQFPETLPNRETEPDREKLSSVLYTFYLWLLDTFVPSFNTGVQEVENNRAAVEASVSAAASSEANALNYSKSAASSAKNEGAWSGLAGYKQAGISVTHIGASWILNVELPYVEQSEPSESNTDWTKATGGLNYKDIVFADSPYQALKNDYLYANTVNGIININTIENPSLGDEFYIDTGAYAETNKIIINGDVIYNGTADNSLGASTNYIELRFKFDGTKWRVRIWN